MTNKYVELVTGYVGFVFWIIGVVMVGTGIITFVDALPVVPGTEKVAAGIWYMCISSYLVSQMK